MFAKTAQGQLLPFIFKNSFVPLYTSLIFLFLLFV